MTEQQVFKALKRINSFRKLIFDMIPTDEPKRFTEVVKDFVKTRESSRWIPRDASLALTDLCNDKDLGIVRTWDDRGNTLIRRTH